MKAVLEFNLPQESQEFRNANYANAYYCALLEFQEWLLKRYKHTDIPHQRALNEYEAIRQKFLDVIEDLNL